MASLLNVRLLRSLETTQVWLSMIAMEIRATWFTFVSSLGAASVAGMRLQRGEIIVSYVIFLEFFLIFATSAVCDRPFHLKFESAIMTHIFQQSELVMNHSDYSMVTNFKANFCQIGLHVYIEPGRDLCMLFD